MILCSVASTRRMGRLGLGCSLLFIGAACACSQHDEPASELDGKASQAGLSETVDESAVSASQKSEVPPTLPGEVGDDEAKVMEKGTWPSLPPKLVSIDGVDGVVLPGDRFGHYRSTDIVVAYEPSMEELKEFEAGLESFLSENLQLPQVLNELQKYMRQYGGVVLREGRRLIAILARHPDEPRWRREPLRETCHNHERFLVAYDPGNQTYVSTIGLSP
jgi:hypothetical protein